MSNSNQSSQSATKILFMMTGSIACYKACSIISKLVQQGFVVQVVASASALEFVGTATLEGLTGRPVASATFADAQMMGHIHHMRWADLILVAPATAHFLNRIAQGVGDDLLSTLFLAHDFKKPFLIAPAMNTSMYLHPITQASIQKLKNLGLQILETASGVLACGEAGYGKLLEPELIFQEIIANLKNYSSNSIDNKKTLPHTPNLPRVLVTGGGTQEPIDNVRSITNTSSGQTGYQIASQLSMLGAEVTYLHSRSFTNLGSCEFEQRTFDDFQSLDQSLRTILNEKSFSHIIHIAAVSDYSVDSITVDGQNYAKEQLNKIDSGHDVSLHLKSNPKLIARLKEYSKNHDVTVIGFKLTSHANAQETQNAVNKVLEFAQFVVHNDTANIDKKTHLHKFSVYDRQHKVDCPHLESLNQVLSSIIFNKEML